MKVQLRCLEYLNVTMCVCLNGGCKCLLGSFNLFCNALDVVLERQFPG